MGIGFLLVLLFAAGSAAAALAHRLPAWGPAALALTLLPPLGLYYLFGSC